MHIITEIIKKSSIIFYANAFKQNALAEKSFSKRINRQIVIICRNTTFKQKEKFMTQIVSDLNQLIQKILSLTDGIIAAKRLFSKNIIVITENSDIRERLKKLKK
jgi:hypothetical protein